MKTLTAAAAKNAFSQFLDAVRHEPVVLTEAGDPVAITLSMQDIETLFGGGEEAVTAALRELQIDRCLAASRQQIAEGKFLPADEAYFDARREKIRAKYMSV